MATVNQHKLSRWLDANPDAFNTMTMERIAQESGTSKSAVNRFLPKLVAARDGILPSEVMERRQISTRRRINRRKVYALQDEGKQVGDIAYLLECTDDAIRKILRAREA